MLKHQEEDHFIQTIRARSKELESINALITEGQISFFKKDQIEEYLEQLEGYADRRLIFQFLSGLDFYCGEYSRGMKHLTAGQRKKRRDNFNLMIRDARSVVVRLKRISTGKDIIAYPSTLGELPFMEDLFGEESDVKAVPFINRSTRKAASKAILSLEEFIDTIEAANDFANPANPLGREKADSAGLIKIIAMFYGRYIRKPKSSPKDVFFTVVKLTLQYLDLPCEDPSRSIKETLKSYKSSPLDKA